MSSFSTIKLMLKKMKDEVKEDIPFYVICTVAIIMCIFSLWRVFSPDFQKNSDDTEANRNVFEYRDDKSIFVYVDPDTGVNYLVYYGSNGRGGITERLNPDGTPFVSY